jgi:DNA mismatch endonuclease (patch repair protein)
VDIVSEEQRSYMMSRVKGADTKPELFLRSLLHRHGLRFRVASPKNRRLPGRPDLVLAGRNTVLFANGCFWHAHPGCPANRMPRSRTEFWHRKLRRNRRRDLSNWRELDRMGWRIVVVWTCALRLASQRERLGPVLDDILRRTNSHYSVAGTPAGNLSVRKLQVSNDRRANPNGA